jgi:hypothetical protein
MNCLVAEKIFQKETIPKFEFNGFSYFKTQS